VRAKQLSSAAADYIRESIISGRITEGQYLRVDHLATELSISATPIREALLALRGEGFVQLEPNRGFVVLPLSGDDILDLFSVQAHLAAELAARSALAITAEDLADLEALQAKLTAAAASDDVTAVERYNHLVHRRINLSGGAPKLSWVLNTLVKYAPRHFFSTIPGWRDASVRDHKAILDALGTHDPDLAREHMRQHIMHAGDLLASHLRRLREDAERSRK
jgi:DNA-binding GntR family transcriptional regulator